MHQLTLTQGDLKQSFHRTELQLKTQNSQQSEKVRSLEIELAQLNKQLKKTTISKETFLQVRARYSFYTFQISIIASIVTLAKFSNGKFGERTFLI